MILDWTKSNGPGYGKLYDANGVELNFPIFFADTETGKIKFLLKEEGNHGAWLSALNGDTVRAEAICAAPLRWVPLNAPLNAPTEGEGNDKPETWRQRPSLL